MDAEDFALIQQGVEALERIARALERLATLAEPTKPLPPAPSAALTPREMMERALAHAESQAAKMPTTGWPTEAARLRRELARMDAE